MTLDFSKNNTQKEEFVDEFSPLANALIKYLGCECKYFPPMDSDCLIIEEYEKARLDGQKEGFVPMLVAVDHILLECFVDENDDIDMEEIEKSRKDTLSEPLIDAKKYLDETLADIIEEFAEDDMDFNDIGELEGGYANNSFCSIEGIDKSRKTEPFILAKIPVKNPWEVFAYLPFGGWNDCPYTDVLMAVSKYWFEKYGAVPSVMTHDVLEYELPKAISKSEALDLAKEHIAFCPDCLNDGMESFADGLWQSKYWFFWWD